MIEHAIEETRANRMASWLATVLQFIGGILTGAATVSIALEMGAPTGNAIIYGLAATFAIGGVLLVFHELGHAIAASFVGDRVHTIAVGPLAWLPRAGRLTRPDARLRQNFGGYVAHSSRFGRWRVRDMSFVVAAGAGMEIGVILASTMIALAFLPERFHESVPFLALGFVILAMVNLIPHRYANGISSDGRHLLDNFKSPNAIDRAELWASVRNAHIPNEPGHPVDDAEWEEFRSRTDLLTSDRPNVTFLYSYSAWLRSDTPALSTLHEHVRDIKDVYPPTLFHAQVGALIAGVDDVDKPELPEGAPVHFGSYVEALFEYRQGDPERAKGIAQSILDTLKEDDGETAILSAIVEGLNIPAGDWQEIVVT